MGGNVITQKQCMLSWCNNTDLTNKIDSLILGGIPSELYCYRCANTYITIRKQIEIKQANRMYWHGIQ